MKLKEAIEEINSLKSNQYSDADKIRWLSELDTTVKHELFDRYGIECSFTGYTEDDCDTELLIPDPYKAAYIYWLESKIDYWNGEYARFNNSIVMYNTAYANYSGWFTANHRRKKKHYIY